MVSANYIYLGIGIILALLLHLHMNKVEGFGDDAESRTVRFGDTITLWTWRSSFMRAGINPLKLDAGNRLPRPEELPRPWYRERFVLEDARDPRGPGNRNPLKMGDKIYLRNYNNTYLRAENDGSVSVSDKRDGWAIFTVVGSDVQNSNNDAATYGQFIYLKTWKNMFVSFGSEDPLAVQTPKREQHAVITIYDEYGQGNVVDWARRGVARQSTTYLNFPAFNAIDGNPLSFSHTQEQSGAWWEIKLPREVLINRIRILNRHDCCQERLSNFDVVVMDHDRNVVITRHFSKPVKEYSLNDLNHIGRIVRIQLRDRNYLHMGEVNVYGKGVEYSLLLNKPLSNEIVTTPVDFSSDTNRVFYPEDLPYNSSTRALTLSFFVKLNSIQPKTVGVLFKGSGSKQRAPQITVSPDGKLNVSVSTNKKFDETLSSGYSLGIGKWNHVAVVIDSGVSPETGWTKGEFLRKLKTAPYVKGTYVMNSILKQYYYLSGDVSAFQNAEMNSWDNSVLTGFRYMGHLKNESVNSRMLLYLNGKMDNKLVLSDAPLINNSPLHLGHFKQIPSANMVLNRFKYYNHGLSGEEIHNDSIYQMNRLTRVVIPGHHNGPDKITIQPHMLPEVTKDLTVSFWMKSDRPNAGTKNWDMIFSKGKTEQDRAPAMWFHPNSNKLHIPVQTKGGPFGGEGLLKPSFSVLRGIWNHYAVVIKGQTQTLYVNGKSVGQAVLHHPVDWQITGLLVGGFMGSLYDMRYSNFAMTANDVKNYMGSHPDGQYRSTVADLWHRKVQCVSDLNEVPEKYVNDWAQMVQAGNVDGVVKSMEDIKRRGENGDETMQKICMGRASSIYGKLQSAEKKLKYTLEKERQGKKCLPMAPFTCQDKGINDFDIRTHKDFYQYVRADKVIPPKISDIRDHPDYPKLMAQVQKSKDQLAQLKNLHGDLSQKDAELQGRMKSMHSNQMLDSVVIKQHPVYQKLSNKLKQNQETLSEIQRQHQRELENLNKAQRAISDFDVKKHPDYVNLQRELDQTRDLAAAKIMKSMNIKDIQNHPLFKKTLERVLSTAQLQQLPQDLKTHPEFVRILSELEKRDKELQNARKMSSQTLQQLRQTQRLTKGILSQLGNDPESVKKAMSSMTVKSLRNNPRLKKMVSHVIMERVQNDPKYKKMVGDLVAQKAMSDPDFRKVIVQANKHHFTSDPEYQHFIKETVTKHLKDTPQYRKMVSEIVRSDDPEIQRVIRETVGPQILKNSRIEDHPEYNKFAKEMRTMKCNKAEKGLQCWNCKLPSRE